ncbi:hypothetical protein HUG15_03095 [Salicibibacter cibarius]|uniref:Uncharacterized protein n=1 Tax=Salicibibacter cibarius TaxID=2743000 RepID=A0A7T7CAB8_9BACI|nr:hypothetical protein [Salicibibacter cibarius]QQK74688.1 hypothetical protein HUG15_03095 [Salicibibacter cibarius]
MNRQTLRKRVHQYAGQLLWEKGYVSPIDVLVKLGRLKPKEVENWRFKRISHLEGSMRGSIPSQNFVLKEIRAFANKKELKPSFTYYKKWGKGPKQRLQFSKRGVPTIEERYATHYLPRGNKKKEE